MMDFGQQYCRLCLRVVSDEHCEQIKGVTCDILDVLQLNLNVNISNKQVMCNDCSRKVTEAFKFKSMCLYTDNTIVPYVDDETGCSVDLREIYVKEKRNNQPIDKLDDLKVCRLCMELVMGNFTLVREVRIVGIDKYIPEINLNVVEDAIICTHCFDSLSNHSNFIRNCLALEGKIKGFRDDNNVESDDEEVLAEIVVESKNQNEDVAIKMECVEIKSEDTDVEGKNGKTRTYKGKQHYCIYCSTLQFKLARHLQNRHKQEEAVLEAMKYEKGSSQRKLLFIEIQKKGDFRYNKRNPENIISLRRKSGASGIPCPYCKGYYSKNNLRNHIRLNCPSKTKEKRKEFEEKESSQNIYPTAKVVNVILLFENGKAKVLTGKNFNEIELDAVLSHSSESARDDESEDDRPLAELILNRGASTADSSTSMEVVTIAMDVEENAGGTIQQIKKKKVVSEPKSKKNNKVTGRMRWSEVEKDLVKKYFEEHIRKKVVPKKDECENLISQNKSVLINKDWVRIKTFVYNTFRNT